MIKYQIIPITEAYIEAYRNVLDSVAKEKKYLSFFEGPSLEMSRSFVLNNLKDNWPHYIAVSEGNVLGWCDITSLERPIFEHVGVLGMGILDKYRGNGIGEALLRTTLNKAKEKGLTRVELTVRDMNKPAIELYKKLGFEVEGLHRNAVRIGSTYENHISMTLLF